MNTTTETPQNIDALARIRVAAKLGFYTHLTVYLVVNAGLIAISVWQGKHWAVFPLLGWGIGLFFHGMSVWFKGSDSALRERMVAKEREKLLSQHDAW